MTDSLQVHQLWKIVSLTQDTVLLIQLSAPSAELMGVLNWAPIFVTMGRLHPRPIMTWMKAHMSNLEKDQSTDDSVLKFSPSGVVQPLHYETRSPYICPYHHCSWWPHEFAHHSFNSLELWAMALPLHQWLGEAGTKSSEATCWTVQIVEVQKGDTIDKGVIPQVTTWASPQPFEEGWIWRGLWERNQKSNN